MHFPRIRDLRTDERKTQAEIAEILFLKREVYRRYETGEREIPAWAVVKLADYYDVCTDYIFGRTKVKKPEYEFIPVEKRFVP